MRRVTSAPPELPGYDYIKPLGAGGFSDVFLYDQKLPRRKVAVKVLLTDELSAGTRAAFVAEANLMAQLSAHPYIVTIFHADVAAGDRPYFVMEYCSRPSLAERYKREVFSAADALRTGVRLSSAIATAHSAGILHRDIKPANVLTNDYGWPALTDFGISSAVDDELPSHTTTTSSALRGEATGGSTESQSVGMSVPWSPPEMFEDNPRSDVRSDVFSLAATIYTLLAGRTPFEIPGRSNGTLDLIGRIERGVITPMTRTDLPRSLVAVLQKGMASDRAERYPSAIEFARALQRVELELGYAPTSIEVPNLDIAEERPTDAGGEDETRVRSVSTIDAQPTPIGSPPALAAPVSQTDETRVRPVTVIDAGVPGAVDQTVLRPFASGPFASGPAASGPVAEETIRRDRSHPTVVEAAPAAPAEAPQVPVDEPRRKRPIAAIIAIAAAVVVVLAVVLGIVLAGGQPGTVAKPKPTTGGGQSAIVGDTIPTPVLVSAKATAGNRAVVFTWSNPDAKSGDIYRWSLQEQPGVSKPLTADHVTVRRPSVGARVCISVVVQRDGITSPDPLEVCNPK